MGTFPAGIQQEASIFTLLLSMCLR
jgi:hypothetical protein